MRFRFAGRLGRCGINFRRIYILIDGFRRTSAARRDPRLRGLRDPLPLPAIQFPFDPSGLRGSGKAKIWRADRAALPILALLASCTIFHRRKANASMGASHARESTQVLGAPARIESLPCMSHSFPEDAGPSHSAMCSPGKPFTSFRDAAPRRLHFHGNGNRVSVVFDKIEDWQFLRARYVQRFPEFTSHS